MFSGAWPLGHLKSRLTNLPWLETERPGEEWHQACILQAFSRCTDRHRQAVTVSAVAPGIFLKGNPPLRTITHKNFNLGGATRGTVAGYFCHGDVRGDTALATFAKQRPIVRAAMPLGPGILPTSKVVGRSGNSVLLALQQWEY